MAYNAGRVILEVYDRDISFETKDDHSPVTRADKASEDIIVQTLKKVAPDIPVIAEEAMANGYCPDISQGRFFLVDPLDGTKEFIHKRNEFTVNISLIEAGEPTFGLIYAPALSEIYFTTTKNIAVFAHLDCKVDAFSLQQQKIIRTNNLQPNSYRVVTSYSHFDAETEDFLKNHKILSKRSLGSSLKFCLLAKGEADLYPRLSRTMEWDTAAGHAILNAAGGCVLCVDGTPFLYGKHHESFANPGFVAWSQHPHVSNPSHA